MAADPNQPIELKAFHSKVMVDWRGIEKEKANYLPLPKIREVTQETILKNYEQIKQDIQEIEQAVFEEIVSDQDRQHLLVRK